MREVLVIVGQVALSLLAAGLIVPLLLVNVPALQSNAAGPYAIVGVIAVVFVILRLAWPARRP